MVPDVDVEADVGRLLSWWWNRFRRTLPVLVGIVRDDVDLDAMFYYNVRLRCGIWFYHADKSRQGPSDGRDDLVARSRA